jgi:hypothetical protein
LTDAKGNTVSEIQGLSTRSDGTVAAVGGPLNASDTLNLYVLSRGDLSNPLYRETFGSGAFMSEWNELPGSRTRVTVQTAIAGSEDEMRELWGNVSRAEALFNKYHIPYGPLTGPGNFNSNSLAHYAGELMGLAATPPNLLDGGPPDVWGWNRNLAERLEKAIINEINLSEARLGRSLTDAEMRPYLDDLSIVTPHLEARCFPAQTRILTSPTSSTAISDLHVGDIVMAFDPRADNGRGALVPKRVKRLFRNTTTEWIRLRWFDGEERELITTPGHHFLDQFGQFPTIEEMVSKGRTTVVLASGVLAEVTAERITYSAETAHMFERTVVRGMTAETAALKRMDMRNWMHHKFAKQLARGAGRRSHELVGAWTKMGCDACALLQQRIPTLWNWLIKP